jgi:hypothetical protein
MDFNELFKLILGMFKLDSKMRKDLKPDDILTVFKQVLDTQKLCRDEFTSRSTYKNDAGFKMT